MQKVKTTLLFLSGFLLFVVVSLVLLSLFNKQVFRNSKLEPWQLIFSCVSIPKDFNNPILDQTFNLGRGVDHLEFEFRNSYVGTKKMILYPIGSEQLWKLNWGGTGYTPVLQFDIEVYKGEKLLFKTTSKQNFEPRSFLTKERILGFSIADFQCPRDVPLDLDLKLKINVIKHDYDFEKNNPFHLKIINSIRGEQRGQANI